MKSEQARLLTLILFFQCITYCIVGQNQREITIHIKTSTLRSLPLSHIAINNKTHFFADEKGKINFSSSDQKINTRISHIGYNTVDTTLNISKQAYHEIVLIPDNYSLSTITISDSQKLFEKNNLWIKDILIHEYGFLVSATEKSKPYIYLFDKEGNQILKTKTKFKHSSIQKGLKPGHYHLMNNREGQEILVATDTIIVLNNSSIRLYDQTINQFKYSNNNYLISEEWTKHNKKLTYYLIDKKTFDKRPFYSATDPSGYITARKSYYSMIAMYNRAIDIDDPKDLDYGMKPPKILNIAAWKGDLFSLIINNEIHGEYHNYINFLSTRLMVSTQVKDDKFYILDYTKGKLSIYNLKEENVSSKKIEIAIPIEIVNGSFMMSDQKHELILTSDNGYYAFDIIKHKFKSISFETQDFYFPKRAFVYSGELYTLACKSIIRNRKYIFRDKMK